MQRNAFYEESASAVNGKKEAKYFMLFHVLGIVFFAIAALGIILSFFWVPSMVEKTKGAQLAFTLFLWIGFIAVFALAGFMFWWVKRRFNVSYDYTFVEDELRITKVFNGRKRKYFTTVQADRILKIGYFENQSYQSTLAGMAGKKTKFLTPNREPAEEKHFIYILVSSSIEKSLYVIECRKDLLEYLVRAAGVNKFERQ